MEKSDLPAPRPPEHQKQLAPPKDRLTIRFPGVHIEGVGRGVNRVLMALVIVAAAILAITIANRLL